MDFIKFLYYKYFRFQERVGNQDIAHVDMRLLVEHRKKYCAGILFLGASYTFGDADGNNSYVARSTSLFGLSVSPTIGSGGYSSDTLNILQLS